MPERRRVRTVFIGVSYSFAAWALLIVKSVDYVVTIRFDSRSDHSRLYIPCRFFCCLECRVNRIPPSLPSSVRADFWLATWTGWVLLFLCSFLVNGRHVCFFCFPGEILDFHVNVARQFQILRDDSWRFTSRAESIWSLHQFRSFLVWWSMGVSVEKILRKAHSSLWTDHAWPG